jgi:hypothetical protein
MCAVKRNGNWIIERTGCQVILAAIFITGLDINVPVTIFMDDISNQEFFCCFSLSNQIFIMLIHFYFVNVCLFIIFLT